MTEPLIHQHIRAAATYAEVYEKNKETLLSSYEAKGERIISGGQTGLDTWDIIDYRTGKVLFEGAGGLEEYARTIEEHGQNWVHIDPITEGLYVDNLPVTEGLPDSLCEALSDWVDTADPEEIEAALK